MFFSNIYSLKIDQYIYAFFEFINRVKFVASRRVALIEPILYMYITP